MRLQKNNRGMLLITSCLLLTVFLAYTSTLTMRTVNYQVVADRLRGRFQALGLAQAALEQLRDDFTRYVQQNTVDPTTGNVMPALSWLDNLGSRLTAGTAQPFLSNVTEAAQGLGLSERTPRWMTLPNEWQPHGQPARGEAWIVSVKNQGEDLNGNGILDAGEDANGNGALDPPSTFTPRLVTLEAKATVGGVTKRIRASYQVKLQTSDIFRHAYFVNNFGWFNLQANAWVMIAGEVRSNGDLLLDFAGWRQNASATILGDLIASKNPALINPRSGMPSTGTISIPREDPNDWSVMGRWLWGQEYWRPPRRLTLPGQPEIAGGNNLLPEGYGWNTESPVFPDQQHFTSQPVQPIPYLGDLSLYKAMAEQRRGTLTYKDPTTGSMVTINGTYNGPDGVAGTADDKTPIILDGGGRWDREPAITVSGPVVIPGDVIIKGKVSGRGTIYAGRNVHVVGYIGYTNGYVPGIRAERNPITGQVRRKDVTTGPESDLGSVCANGSYRPPGAGPVATRCN